VVKDLARQPSAGDRRQGAAAVPSQGRRTLDGRARCHAQDQLLVCPGVSPDPQGRPSRMQAIERYIEFALDRGDIRFSRTDQLADIVLGDPDEQEKKSV
jgi:hypothetical protein